MPQGLSGGVVLAVAAVLWLVYLAPSFLRRRQYLHTERSAVRLQQTLRVLAETAEAPDEVRADLTAKSVAEQHRYLRAAAHRAEAVARAEEAAAARALARRGRRAPREPRQRAAAVSALASARLRRSRLLAAGVLIGGLVLIAWGVAELEVLPGVAGGVAVLGAVAVLQRAATVAAARRAVQAVDHAVTVPPPRVSFADWQLSEPERPTWTPVPLPKPRYLDREEAPRREPARAREALVADSAQAVAALRAAQEAVAAVVPRAAPPAPVEVDATGPALGDLDAVLRRRRAS